MLPDKEVMSQERFDHFIDEAAKAAGYEEGFGITGSDLNLKHWWAAYTRQSTREQAENDRLGEYLLTCARLKDLAKTDKLTPPWYWDNEVRIATPAGICCFEAGKEYEHGGLSPQECIVPVLTISRPATPASAVIEKITWKGLRCTISISGASSEAIVDIRIKPGDPATSIVSAGKSPDISGNVSLLVENDEYEGQAAVVVVLDDEGQICYQLHTTAGG